ncbi:MAG TPA: DUF1343 domain-containing protein [Gemmatimonadaceae bacterium]|nr:DUF1343 domain-containing protein [Gemmatimonadaceae bacterium]
MPSIRHALALLATLAAALLSPANAWCQVTPGITVLVRDSLHLLRGKRVGLITNHTGRDAAGVSSIDLLARAPDVKLVALFGPEHGLRGVAQAGEKVAASVDSATGVPVFSLYGSTLVPTAKMLENVDVLVYDIQDVGSRTYTYAWTMALSADAAGRRGIPFIVCDRPVPVRGDVVQGGMLDTAYRSFVGQYPVALRYGLTAGEMLRHLVRTGQVKANIVVAPMQGWARRMWYDETGLPWIVPSPNLRTLDAALLYTGTVFVEGTTMSEGRGTDAPFQLVGAPWLRDAGAIARELSAARLPGVAFDSVSRTVAAGQKHGGLTIPMIRITVTDRNAVDPVRTGMALLLAIRQRHPKELELRSAFMDKLAGDTSLRRAIESGSAAQMTAVYNRWKSAAARFAADARVDHLYR